MPPTAQAQPARPLTSVIGSNQPVGAFGGAPTTNNPPPGQQAAGFPPANAPTGIGAPPAQPSAFGAQFGAPQVPTAADFTPTPVQTAPTRLGRMRQVGGQFGEVVFPESGGFSRRLLPLIEARLNFEQRLQAEQDRQAALDLLGFQRQNIGAAPGAQAAREVALQRLLNPDPFSPEELSIQQSQIRQRGGIALEDAMRALEQDLARQGVGGSASSFQQAQLEQAGARQVSEELMRLAIDNALQSDINEAQAIDRLAGLEGEDELRRIALGTSIADILREERGPIDLSGLVAVGPKRELGRGGLLTEISKVLG